MHKLANVALEVAGTALIIYLLFLLIAGAIEFYGKILGVPKW